MKRQPTRATGRRMHVADGVALRSPQEICDELYRRTGVRISRARVYQHLESAHQKIAAALAALADERGLA